MTDIQAAVGRIQLRRLPDFLRQRRRLAGRYAEILADVPGLEAPVIPDYVRPNFQAYPVCVTDEYPLSRDELMQELLEVGISTRRGIMNAHQEAPYASTKRSLPHSEAARDGVILLPLYSQMTDEEQDYVIEALKR
jgi:dTDP-4-amino-4,6-dideoxygalactose transaminase